MPTAKGLQLVVTAPHVVSSSLDTLMDGYGSSSEDEKA
jgi:hypothetical protein